MNNRTVLCQCILVIALALCLATTTTVAQDMAKVAPNNVKVILDNDETRVLDVHYKAGEKLPMHSHPANIVYSLTAAKVKTTLAGGKVVEREFKAGDAIWNEKVTHSNEALTDVHVIVIEFKEHKKMK
jgi:beta-alanine degradation protein BauB